MQRKRRTGKGRTRKKRRTTPLPPGAPVAKSFIMKRGKVGKTVQRLVEDMRRVMMPNTALNLRERKTNKLKDFVHVAGPLGITHFLMFSATESGTYLKLVRVPHGPTLSFRVCNYSLMHDIAALHTRPPSLKNEYRTPPLLVLHSFVEQQRPLQLTSLALRNLFPPMNIQTLQLSDCRRVVLFKYNPETETIQFRHYLIAIRPVGVSRSVRHIAQAQIPDNLKKFQDISEYVLREAEASESEGEEAEVDIPEKTERQSTSEPAPQQRSSVRLVEIGPRMELQLLKVQQDLCEGEVLYHRFVQKSTEEADALRKQKQSNKKEKDDDEDEVMDADDEGEEEEQVKEEKEKEKTEQKKKKKPKPVVQLSRPPNRGVKRKRGKKNER